MVRFVADEPTGNLDSETSEEIVRLLRTLSERDGQTVVLVTHEVEVVSAAPRTIRMRDGRIVNGTPPA